MTSFSPPDIFTVYSFALCGIFYSFFRSLNRIFLHCFCHLSDGAIWCHSENFSCIHKWYHFFSFRFIWNGKCEKKNIYFCCKWLSNDVQTFIQFNGISKCWLKLKNHPSNKQYVGGQYSSNPTNKIKFIISIISWMVNGNYES